MEKNERTQHEQRVAGDTERKNAEMARQRALAQRENAESPQTEDPLDEEDKTSADSFPASDPPSH
jgi:hypothetical protein